MTDRLQVVAVEDLADMLGFAEEARTPTANLYTPYPAYEMKRHDAPVLRYLLRNHRPKRHLEFGTWEGFGVVLCAHATDAHIWTINLPDGERDAKTGAPLYPNRAADGASDASPSDAGACIGRLYREAGLEARVTQILADSRQWRHDAFGDGFFDSVFIDGGHAPDVVSNDTAIAIRLLRSGGLCLWHDFCPAPEAIAEMPATRGVVEAVANGFNAWKDCFSKLFWIRRTFLLVGVRA